MGARGELQVCRPKSREMPDMPPYHSYFFRFSVPFWLLPEAFRPFRPPLATPLNIIVSLLKTLYSLKPLCPIVHLFISVSTYTSMQILTNSDTDTHESKRANK